MNMEDIDLNMIIDSKEIGRRIRKRRRELRLRQRDIAGNEFTVGYISQLEVGNIYPSVKALTYLGKVLEVPLSYFLDPEYEEKKDLLEKIKKLDNSYVQFLEAERLIRNGAYNEAKNLLERFLDEFDPNDPRYIKAKFLMICCYIETENYKLAAEWFDDFIGTLLSDDNNLKYAAWLYYKIGISYWMMERHLKALRTLEKGVDLIDKNNLDLHDLKGKMLLNIANLLIKVNNYVKARDYFMMCMNYSKDHGLVKYIGSCYHGIGFTSYYLNEYKDAIKNIRRAIFVNNIFGLKEEVAKEYNYLGYIYIDMKQYDFALKNFEKSMEIYKELNKMVYVSFNLTEIGRIQYLQGNYNQALKYLERADKLLSENPNFLEERCRINRLIGDVYAAQQEYVKAEDSYKRAESFIANIDAEKEKAALGEALGNLYYRMGRVEEALDYFSSTKNEDNVKSPLRDSINL
ncbi:tetratricopeptide repeat protein [Calorimonas adulescens]|uniref:Tetratricopeptide repeat protein n=1 Tax=Calorimonas adulescens TaxID=2606906 RepID=A0A5D8QCL5_9THEO|nr:tetratricopeptide repeat protein [Calorimonas adulescens]TZE82137.1 tetratricopeptide repeat protein [Calorimonas adulescens]